MQVQIKYFASLREALGPGERRDTQAAAGHRGLAGAVYRPKMAATLPSTS